MDHFRYMPDNLPEAPEKIEHKGLPAPLISSTSLPTLDRMSREMAAKLVRRLLAGYPHLNAHDPEGYIAALVQVMEQFPQWAGERVVGRGSPDAQFPPTDKVLRAWLTDEVRPIRFAVEWNARAQRQIAERPRD